MTSNNGILEQVKLQRLRDNYYSLYALYASYGIRISYFLWSVCLTVSERQKTEVISNRYCVERTNSLTMTNAYTLADDFVPAATSSAHPPMLRLSFLVGCAMECDEVIFTDGELGADVSHAPPLDVAQRATTAQGTSSAVSVHCRLRPLPTDPRQRLTAGRLRRHTAAPRPGADGPLCGAHGNRPWQRPIGACPCQFADDTTSRLRAHNGHTGNRTVHCHSVQCQHTN